MSVEIVMRIVRPFLISPTHPRQKPHAPQHLAVVSRQVVESAEGWGSDSGVVPVVIVEVDPAR